MRPSIARSDFAALARQTGVQLTPEQRSAAYEAYGTLEPFIARVRSIPPERTAPGEAGLATRFDADAAWADAAWDAA